jgi:hypothetical protein
MGVLKKYVRNRARPEGSISKGYGTEEVIEFCVDFLPNLNPIGVPESRYEDRLTGKGTLGRKVTVCMGGHSFTQAHYTLHSILKTRRRLTLGLKGNTRRLLAVGCRHIS